MRFCPECGRRFADGVRECTRDGSATRRLQGDDDDKNDKHLVGAAPTRPAPRTRAGRSPHPNTRGATDRMHIDRNEPEPEPESEPSPSIEVADDVDPSQTAVLRVDVNIRGSTKLEKKREQQQAAAPPRRPEPAPPPGRLPREGDSLGDYRFGAIVARSSEAATYLAEQRLQLRPEVITVASGDVSNGPLQQRLESGVRGLEDVVHPSVGRVLRFFKLQNTMLAISEEGIEEGRSLHDALAAETSGALAPSAWLPVAYQLAQALAALHAAKRSHGLIVPRLVAYERQPDETYVVRLHGCSAATALDATGGFLDSVVSAGTSEYVAPEVLRRGVADARADVYALGAILFRIAGGRACIGQISNETVDELLAMHRKPVRPLTAARGAMAPGYDTLALELLAKEPASRPSAPTIVKRLEGLMRRR